MFLYLNKDAIAVITNDKVYFSMRQNGGTLVILHHVMRMVARDHAAFLHSTVITMTVGTADMDH